MNLLQKAKPELTRKLEDLKNKFPANYRAIKYALETNNFYFDVKFSIVLACRTYLNISLDQFSEQFNK